MPRIDFTAVEDAQDFTPIPDGEYRCRVAEVEETATQMGDDMWNVELEVVEGEYAGRRIFDRLVFSDSALKRVKLVCRELGIDVSGEVDLVPETIRGRDCIVTVVTEEYENRNGETKRANRVPFTGYRSVGDDPDRGASY